MKMFESKPIRSQGKGGLETLAGYIEPVLAVV